MLKVLYVNHKAKQCGVYEFGKEIGHLLERSSNFAVTYIECDKFEELISHYNFINPDIILYNHHPITMPWLDPDIKMGIPQNYYLNTIQVGTIHEVYQKLADTISNYLFDFHVAPDPTLLLNNPFVYKTGRLLPEKIDRYINKNTIPTIGSFGFATPNKGFEKIIHIVQNEFDEAIINLNIPFGAFADSGGQRAVDMADRCRKMIFKKDIILNIDHTYLEKQALLSFLSKNDINVFLYDNADNRGISSATDWALASGRPIAISKSSLFRHLFNCTPSICVTEGNGLKEIISNGIKPIKHLYKEFSDEVILSEYEAMFNDIINKKSRGDLKRKSTYSFYKNKISRKLNHFISVIGN